MPTSRTPKSKTANEGKDRMKTEQSAEPEGQENLPANKLLEGIEAALEFHREEMERRKEQCRKAKKWLKRHSANRDSETWIINLIQSCDLEDYYVILSGHVFWEEHELREGLRSLFGFAYQACVDVCSREKGIAAYEIGSRGPPLDVQLTHPADLAQKDFMAYCASAIGIRDTLCRIIEIRSDDGLRLSRLCKDCFESEAGVLIALLRNSLFHARLLSPVSSVSVQGVGSKKGTRLGVMYILRSQLIDLRDRHLEWCKGKSRRTYENAKNRWDVAFGYFDKICDHDDWAGDVVSLSRIVADHFQKLNHCYRSVREILRENVTDTERDFRLLIESAFSLEAN